ncbi:hypothetical protein [Vibrio cyclitrophicus]|uniref:hypothetical protein n=1 Tax=Vibrio cyclitrophicus TaxID=47951 RepID=UPI000373FC2A|nr:hypothetical protein [Vibrio cyclitrophicus]OEF52563.1 hypothetical protein OAC_00010 [Vibrio cyclitrophicus 1F273]
MSVVNKRTLPTLKLIQLNKNCNSNQHDFDPEVLAEIHNKGFIEAEVFTPMKTGIPHFIDMRITVDGIKALEESEAIKDSRWHTNPFLIAFLTLIILVSSSMIVDWLRE